MMCYKDLEAAHNSSCIDCVSASVNSNDYGKMPCLIHKAAYLNRQVPVIRTTGLMDGDWTHTSVDTQSIRYFVRGILEEFSDQEISIDRFVDNIGITVESMPLPELNKVPEL
jgi:hypothetical protein